MTHCFLFSLRAPACEKAATLGRCCRLAAEKQERCGPSRRNRKELAENGGDWFRRTTSTAISQRLPTQLEAPGFRGLAASGDALRKGVPMSIPPDVPPNVPTTVPRPDPQKPFRRATRYLSGAPSGWRFQYRLPRGLAPPDSTLSKSRATIRKWLGPLPIRAARQKAELLASMCRVTAAAALASKERAMEKR